MIRHNLDNNKFACLDLIILLWYISKFSSCAPAKIPEICWGDKVVLHN